MQANKHHYRHQKESQSQVVQLCPTLCDPMDYSLPGSSVHGIFQARVLEWIAISFSIRRRVLCLKKKKKKKLLCFWWLNEHMELVTTKTETPLRKRTGRTSSVRNLLLSSTGSLEANLLLLLLKRILNKLQIW